MQIKLSLMHSYALMLGLIITSAIEEGKDNVIQLNRLSGSLDIIDKKGAWIENDKEDLKQKEASFVSKQNVGTSDRTKRFLNFFYFLTIAGISFTISLYFYLKANKNRLLLAKEREAEIRMARLFEKIAYNLRNPLTLILGPIDVIAEKVTAEEMTLINIARNNTKKLLYQANQMLYYSKLNQNKLELTASKNDIIPLLKGIFFSYKTYAEMKGVLLKYSSDFDSFKLYFDPDMMEKIIINLISNALHFTSLNGQVSLNIREEEHSDKKYFMFEIADTGKGISDENLPFIFDGLYQIGKQKEDNWEGTGVGLPLVKELVSIHKGKIEVDSKLCQGTSIKLYFPIGRNHIKSEQITFNHNETPHSDLKLFYEAIDSKIENEYVKKDNKKLILVIDDDTEMRQYLRKILHKDYSIIEASDGKSGYEKAKTYFPHLIISDIIMPKMNGLELCSELKFDELTCHIPIVLISAKMSYDDRIDSLEKHADTILNKPFNVKELRATVKNLIEIRERIRDKYTKNGYLPQTDEKELQSTDQKFLSKVYQFIDENYTNENFGVEDISKGIGLSRSQLQRKIKDLTGDNPNQLIKNYRLKKAMNLLKNNAGSVSEIYFKVGFSSHSYFTKCFVEKYGYAPKNTIQKQT